MDITTMPGKAANRDKPLQSGAWLLCLAVLLLPGWTGQSLLAQGWSQPDAAVFADVAEQLARYFPKVTGEVVKVEDGDIYLSLGARNDILPGTQLTLLRSREAVSATDGEQAVNRLEEAIGYVIVEQVFEGYALAKLLASPGTEAQRGDKVRVTSGPVILGVLPVVNGMPQPLPHGRWTTALQSALEANGRFRVVTANRILLWSLEHDTPLENGVSPDLLRQMAQSLRFTYAVVALVKDVGGEPVLDVALLSPQLQRLVASGSAFLPTP
jgi:hypothetical protein